MPFKLSDKGLLANEIMKLLGGKPFSSSILANEKLIIAFNQYGNDKIIPSSKMMEEVREIIPGYGDNELTEEIYIQKLIELQIVKQVIIVKCPTCSRRNWYLLDEVDYSLKCKNCLTNYKFPPLIIDGKKIDWGYIAQEPFNFGNSSDGSYSVLLTSRFFKFMHSYQITETYSFITNLRKKDIEIDLGLIMKHENEAENLLVGEDSLFVECKCNNSFDISDFKENGIDKKGISIFIYCFFEALKINYPQMKERS